MITDKYNYPNYDDSSQFSSRNNMVIFILNSNKINYLDFNIIFSFDFQIRTFKVTRDAVD